MVESKLRMTGSSRLNPSLDQVSTWNIVEQRMFPLPEMCFFLIIIITLYDDIISIHLDLYHIISFHFIWSHIILSYHIITCHIISVCSTLAPLLQASSYTMVLCSFPVHCHWVFRNNIYIYSCGNKEYLLGVVLWRSLCHDQCLFPFLVFHIKT